MLVKKIFKSFVFGKIKPVDHTSAELIKLAENTYRSVNIAFSNELLKICLSEKIGYNIIRMSNEHPRVNILNAVLVLVAIAFLLTHYFLLINLNI